MTSQLDRALAYAANGWPVFPCAPWPRKTPLTENGFHDATRDKAAIREWCRRGPRALIAIPTGRASGFVVLDVDVKSDKAYGFDSLGELGHAILPMTPTVHTASGGLHLYFNPGPHLIRNTEGARGRGIGPGLDWRGEGGYVILPSPGSGYQWDPHWNLDTAPLAPVPAALLPREPEPRPAAPRPMLRTSGLSPYADGALDRACRAIIVAPCGEQETTLHNESFAIGTLAAAGGGRKEGRALCTHTAVGGDEAAPIDDHPCPHLPRQPRIDINGKPIFNQIIEFRGRATADRFSPMVIDLVCVADADFLAGEK